MVHQPSACDFPVNFRGNGYEYSGIAKKISKSGLFIEITKDIEVNSNIDLEFTQPRTTIPIRVGGNVTQKNIVGEDVFGIEVTFNLAE